MSKIGHFPAPLCRRKFCQETDDIKFQVESQHITTTFANTNIDFTRSQIKLENLLKRDRFYVFRLDESKRTNKT